MNAISNTGLLCQSLETGYVYLKVDDRFIHTLFPLLEEEDPPWRSAASDPNNIGAHISIIYPEENVGNRGITAQAEIFNFEVTDLYRAEVHAKTFVILGVVAPALENLRIQHGFLAKPCYHEIPVDFHITLARGGLK